MRTNKKLKRMTVFWIHCDIGTVIASSALRVGLKSYFVANLFAVLKLVSNVIQIIIIATVPPRIRGGPGKAVDKGVLGGAEAPPKF